MNPTADSITPQRQPAPAPTAAQRLLPQYPPNTAHPILRFFRQIGPAGPVALVATCLPAVGAMVLAGFARSLSHWLAGHGILGLLVFVAGYALTGGFALVPTYANSILGGWTYKFAVGFPAVFIGLAGAAFISFTLAHRIIGHRVADVIHEHPKWQVVRDALVGGSTMKVIGIITLLRLSPLLPFETTNVLLASCEVRVLPFLVGTLLGVTPRTAAVVFMASRAHKLELAAPGHRWLAVLAIVMSLLAIVVVTIISKHALDRATRGSEPSA